MNYIKLFKVNILLLSILLTIQPIAHANNEAITMGEFMWIYKNMMVQVYDNTMPELSLKIANLFQKEVEHELKRLHKNT